MGKCTIPMAACTISLWTNQCHEYLFIAKYNLGSVCVGGKVIETESVKEREAPAQNDNELLFQ